MIQEFKMKSSGLLLMCALVLVLHHVSATCKSYQAPEVTVRIKGGLLEEESGIASSRKNEGIVWIHNDNYDLKRVYGVSVKPGSEGKVVAIIDLTSLPGINKYTDFEDISVANCPFQENIAYSKKQWCIWVGDVGNNAEWGKGTFMYVVNEPEIEPELLKLNEPMNIIPSYSITFRIKYEGYEDTKGPNVEAMTTAVDGSKFWVFRKTYSKNGNGPAGIWESPNFLSDVINFNEDKCTVDNGTWFCKLVEDRSSYLVSNPNSGAKVTTPQLQTFANMYESNHKMIMINLKKINEILNPQPSIKVKKKHRNIAGADLHDSGKSLLIATYGGIFEYELKEAFNMSESSLIFKRQISSTNRDGSYGNNGIFWSGQEGVAYDEQGQGVWSVSEHHKKLYYLKCNL